MGGDKYNDSGGKGMMGFKVVSSPGSSGRIFGIDFTGGNRDPEPNGAHSMPDRQR